MRFRIIIIAMVMFLLVYPVVELTRCIFQYNLIPLQSGAVVLYLGGWVATEGSLYAELAVIWGFYLVVPFLLNIALKLACYQGGERK